MSGPTRDYHRPQQKWVCGRRCGGQCAQGPTATGDCKTTTACVPTKNGDRWHCNRSPLQGGECERGPSPEGHCCLTEPACVPRRSLRSQRGIAASVSFVFTIGVLLVLFGLPEWRAQVSPGPLASPHAQLLKSQSAEAKCAACHQEFDFESGEWLSAFAGDHPGPAHAMSSKCMECHQQEFAEQWARHPHSLAPETTSQLTEAFYARTNSEIDESLIQLASFIPRATDQLECAACHQEHQGMNVDLTKITDKKCQSCHAQQFESFSNGHPEFDQWPLQQSPSIKFNHTSHSGKHFADRNQRFDCNSCHIHPQTREVVSVVSFEQSCAACHEEQLQQAVSDGIPLLALPMIDRETLAGRLSPEFRWPREAEGDFDGRVPALMQFLLQLDALPEPFTSDLDLSLIDPDNEGDLEFASKLLPRIRRLWFELAADGQDAVIGRVEAITGEPMSKSSARGLSSLLPLDLFRVSYDRWFKSAPPERSGDRLSPRGIQLLAGDGEPARRMYVADEMIVLPGDELLLDSLPPGEWVGPENGGSVNKTLPENVPPASTTKPKPPETQPIEDQTTESDVVTPPIEDSQPSIPEPEPIQEPERPLPQPVEVEKKPKPAPGPSPSATKPSAIADLSAIDWRRIPQRGWYQDDLTWTIGYRPEGHADPFMKSWLELAFSATGEREVPAVAKLREQLSASAPFRNCLSCHDLERDRSRGLPVNWLSNSKHFRPKSFTTFSHRPHLTIPQLQDCRQCHALDEAQSAATGSEFSRISIRNCTQCHNADGASQSCSECHNYHIDHRSLTNGN